MVGESNQIVLLIQIDASSFAEFEISKFEIARVDCIMVDPIITVKPASVVEGLLGVQQVVGSIPSRLTD